MITGMSRIELAKMTGMTPDWLTFKRDVGVLPAVHAATDDTFGELHRDPSLAEFDVHDGDDDARA